MGRQEYADTAAELVKLRREAKLNGNFFVEPEVTRNFNGIHVEVSEVIGVPLSVNGFIHGKSYSSGDLVAQSQDSTCCTSFEHLTSSHS